MELSVRPAYSRCSTALSETHPWYLTLYSLVKIPSRFLGSSPTGSWPPFLEEEGLPCTAKGVKQDQGCNAYHNSDQYIVTKVRASNVFSLAMRSNSQISLPMILLVNSHPYPYPYPGRSLSTAARSPRSSITASSSSWAASTVASSSQPSAHPPSPPATSPRSSTSSSTSMACPRETASRRISKFASVAGPGR